MGELDPTEYSAPRTFADWFWDWAPWLTMMLAVLGIILSVTALVLA